MEVFLGGGGRERYCRILFGASRRLAGLGAARGAMGAAWCHTPTELGARRAAHGGGTYQPNLLMCVGYHV